MSAHRKDVPILIKSSEKDNTNDPNYNFGVLFTNPIQFPNNSFPRVRPVSFSSEMNWRNVSTQYSNRTFIYTSGTTLATRTVTFPEGNYNMADINNYLVSYQETNGDGAVGPPFVPDFYIQIDKTEGAVTIVINTPGTIVSFSDPTMAGMADLLGFPYVDVAVTTQGGRPDITAGVNEIEIHCTAISGGSGLSRLANDVIMSFQFIDEVPFAPFIIEPKLDVEYDISSNNSLHEIRIRLTDQLGRPFVLDAGTPVTMRLILSYDI